jgi:hypothetical protein
MLAMVPPDPAPQRRLSKEKPTPWAEAVGVELAPAHKVAHAGPGGEAKHLGGLLHGEEFRDHLELPPDPGGEDVR